MQEVTSVAGGVPDPEPEPREDGVGTHAARVATRPAQRVQWAAVVVTVVVVLVFAVVLPRVAANSVAQDTQLAAGQRVEAGGASIEPPTGWSRTAGTELLVISKDSAKLVVFPPAQDPTAPEEAIGAAEEGYTADTTLHATLGDISTFTTDSGLKAATVTVVQQDEVTILYAFSDGTVLAQAQLSVGASDRGRLEEEINEMMSTFELTGAGS
jgi:hypothetical protein